MGLNDHMEFHTVCLCARPVSKMGSGSSLHGPTYRHMFIWSYWVSSHHIGCILSKIFVNLLSIQQTLVKYGEQAKIQNLWKTHLRLFNITRPWLMGKGSKTSQSHGLGWVGQSGVFLFFNTTFFFFLGGGNIVMLNKTSRSVQKSTSTQIEKKLGGCALGI